MSSYALDKGNCKMLGVCAGLARSTGWDPLAIRLGPIGPVVYIVTAMVAEAR